MNNSQEIVKAVLDELLSRGGFDGVWDSIDDEVREEIKHTLATRVEEVLKPKILPARQSKPFVPEDVPPVDRTQRDLTNEVEGDHLELKDNGQQKAYVILSDAERAKGFVRPVRLKYVHEKCGGMTEMRQDIAETYARDPYFYSGTFCVHCSAHFPVGEYGEFVWDGTDIKVGT